jgi:signal transduction histidine kinase
VGPGRRALTVVGLVAGLLAAPARAAPAGRQVLILRSLDRGGLIFDRFTTTLRSTIAARATVPVTFAEFELAPAEFVDHPEEPLLSFLRSAFVNGSKPDLVVTVGGPATGFTRRYRAQIFRDMPVLFGVTEWRFVRETPLADTETAVSVDIDYARTIEEILQLRPETSTICVVAGAGRLTRAWHDELDPRFERFRDRLTFIWSDAWSYAQLLERAERLPANSAILFLTAVTDAEVGWNNSERTLADLAAHANAPLFAVHQAWLGLGIVGGTLVFDDDLAVSSADVALRILNGASPRSIRLAPQALRPPVFDARQLERWQIPEARLPAGSVVMFRAPSVWREYRGIVLTAGAVGILETSLIVGLLYQRRARQRADRRAREQLTVSAHLGRQVALGEMAATFAHELSQPLGAMRFNLEAAERLIATNRATPDELREILRDVRSQDGHVEQIIQRHRSMLKKREVEKRPVDVSDVVREGLALLAHDIQARRVVVKVQLPAAPCVVDGDAVLLQQVIVNLVTNAMDAVQETPLERKQIVVSTEMAADHVEVAVRDYGPGLPQALNGRLFEPFVTTKAHGLGIGLNIVRGIVEAHGGTIRARNVAEGGAEFRFTVPIAVAQG